MTRPVSSHIAAVIATAAASLGTVAPTSVKAEDAMPQQRTTQVDLQKKSGAPPQDGRSDGRDIGRYVGMWVTGDGRIRQELLPNGRYDEARGTRQSAYQGRYEVSGEHIDYWDDTGFTADGTFVDEDTLHHGGMIFYRQKP